MKRISSSAAFFFTEKVDSKEKKTCDEISLIIYNRISKIENTAIIICSFFFFFFIVECEFLFLI